MEDYLDAVSRNEAEHLNYLRHFYLGTETNEKTAKALESTALAKQETGLKPLLESKVLEIDPRSAMSILFGNAVLR